jgi:hypothetical protein
VLRRRPRHGNPAPPRLAALPLVTGAWAAGEVTPPFRFSLAADAEVAHRLGCAPGLPVLRIDRLYRDRDLTPLELAVNHFHPDRYSYRIQLRAQPDH